MLKDTRRGRQWVKVQLRNDPDAGHVGQIVDYWKHMRQATHHLTRAIRMYYALTQGDTSLLTEYFPFISGGLQGERRVFKPAQPARLESKAKSEEEDVNDFLDSIL